MSDITDSTVFKLHRATALLDRIADLYLQREHGIRYSQFLPLLIVRVIGEPTQSRIADNLGVSRASVTQRIAPLVADGLLAVRQHPTDARAKLVTLTERGTTLVDAAWAGLTAHQDGVEDGVDDSVLAAQLDRLIANALPVAIGGNS
jgi:DNA-binding MarR family transcriptional regulator